MHIFLEHCLKMSALTWTAVAASDMAFILAIVGIFANCSNIKRYQIVVGLLYSISLCLFLCFLSVRAEINIIKDIENYVSDGEYQQAIEIAQYYGLKDEEYEVLCLYADALYRAKDYSSALEVYEKIENYDTTEIEITPLEYQEKIEICRLKILEDELENAYDKAKQYQKEGNSEKSEIYFKALRYGEIE